MDETEQSEFVSRLVAEVGRLSIEVATLERKVISQKFAHKTFFMKEALG
jgi:hypothetical protein